MIISTTRISERYRVIDTIMLMDHHRPLGMFKGGGFDFEGNFETTKMKLEQKAEAMGGNAVIGCNFEVRIAVAGMGNSQVLEIYCFGTVVEILE